MEPWLEVLGALDEMLTLKASDWVPLRCMAVVASDLFRGELMLFEGENAGRIDVVVLSGEVSVESSLLIKLSLEVFEAKSPTSCNNK